MFGSDIVSLIISVVLFIAVFMLLRNFFCWYWKMNSVESKLEAVNEKLQTLIDLQKK